MLRQTSLCTRRRFSTRRPRPSPRLHPTCHLHRLDPTSSLPVQPVLSLRLARLILAMRYITDQSQERPSSRSRTTHFPTRLGMARSVRVVTWSMEGTRRLYSTTELSFQCKAILRARQIRSPSLVQFPSYPRQPRASQSGVYASMRGPLPGFVGTRAAVAQFLTGLTLPRIILSKVWWAPRQTLPSKGCEAWR